MNGKEYLNNIRAEEMSKEELKKEIRKLYEDNWAIAKQCDTLEEVLNARFKKEANYEKQFNREVIVREYANSNLYDCNMTNERQEVDKEGNIIGISFTEWDYIPDKTQRIAGMAIADWELLPIHKKIKAYIGCWFDDCVEYLRGIWGITN